MKQFLEAGKAVTTHGIKGELKLYPWCDSAHDLCKLKKLYLDDKGHRPVKIESAHVHKNMVLVKFEGYNTIEEARKLIGQIFYLDRNSIELPEGVHFVVDLIGLTVIDADYPDTVYGTLIDVTETGAHGIYHIKIANGHIGMIPAVKEMIISIDVEGGTMKIRPPKGLFDDED